LNEGFIELFKKLTDPASQPMYKPHKESTMSPKILVTGANGFIGSAMVWELNQSDITDIICVDSVILSHRKEPLRKRKYTSFLHKDELWNFLNSDEAQSISWVIHMGACSSTTEKNWSFLYENNTLYTQRLFQWCTQNKKNLIYASSAATYGGGELGFDDETPSEILKPLNLYGDSKVLFDRWVVEQKTTPPSWYGLKFFNVYGPNEYHKESMASVVFKAFGQVKTQNSLGLFKSYNSLYRDGEQKRDFIYVKDVTRWMLELMKKTPKNGIYNMGFGSARTWKDLAQSVFSNLNKPMLINWLEVPDNIKDQYQYFTEAKMKKWNSESLSAPQWPIEKGIQDYISNYLLKNDPWL